jgi:predicted  nucleic acid-binding Zn-ribbon protein
MIYVNDFQTALSKVEIRCAELEETLEQSEKRNGVLKEQFSASEEQHSKLQHHVEAYEYSIVVFIFSFEF